MTPQLVQSIKLLQMNSVELLKHIEQEIEKNPLLELADDAAGEEHRGEIKQAAGENSETDRNVSTELDTDQPSLEEKLGTSLENEFDSDRAPSTNSLSGTNQGNASVGDIEAYNIEAFIEGKKSLREHLAEQLALSRVEPEIRAIASDIIDTLDADGYFRRELPEMAKERSLELTLAERALALVQTFEPLGIAARSLSECLAIQLIDQDRYDPAMQALIENLELLAKKDFKSLSRICDVEMDDILDMADEIKSLDPRPARAFDHSPLEAIIPDAFVSERADGSFVIELNAETMPRVLVNQTYSAVVSKSSQNSEDKTFIAECLQSANWLVRSLEQRAQTILKVLAEIVKQQDGFFVHGPSHLRPMSLKQVADAIKMHESTVSRVTSNKYVLTPRGVFELKFFFTAAIAALDGAESHSAEAVRIRIRQLIDAENLDAILSDDTIVEMLKDDGIDIARRTVAKYRESMHLASSVQRRREKRALQTR